MVPETSINSLITKLTASLDSALNALPEPESQLSVANGISLLDLKTELLLSYLQNLVFLILVKLKNASSSSYGNGGDESGDGKHNLQMTDGAANNVTTSSSLADEAVNKLVELRVYLEKGVRPLEGRLKYQIDKVLRAADTAARDTVSSKAKPARTVNNANGTTPTIDGDSNEEDEDEDEDEEDEDSDASIDELAYRPNPSAFNRTNTSTSITTSQKSRTNTSTSTGGVYRPPRITPTALPTTTSSTFNDKPQRSRALERSRTLDDYIASELSGAPTAEPSIGSNVALGGQRTKTAREREQEAERKAYEEANFVRLPGQSRKEAKRGRDSRAAEDVWGGEEMRGLGDGADRISRLTRKRRGGAGEDMEERRGGGRKGKRRRVGGR